MLIFIYTLFAILLIGILFLYWISPGKAVQYNCEKEKNKSISIIESIQIGGIKQTLIIRGFDASKPVLLFLHGGPGTPELSYIKKHNPNIEKEFVLVYWEQRGAGKTYKKSTPIESMNIQQFISDSKEISQWLISRFKKEKIYLMGHSWGSLLGIYVVKTHPELFHCYFGIGQIANQIRSEIISFEWVKKQAELKKDRSGIKKLNKLQFPEKNDSCKKWLNFLLIEKSFIDKYGGGLLRNYSGKKDAFLPILLAKEYTLKDKFNYTRAAFFSIKTLWTEIMNTNLFESIDSLEVPAYFFHGLHDYQATHEVANDYFHHIKAPEKKFFTFENSAHSPILDEPTRFNEIIIELINK